MPRKVQLFISITFLCFAVAISATQAESQGRGRPAALPDGPGKDLVQMQCTKCHALGLIANAGGNTRQEWTDLFGTMVKLSNDQRDLVAEYLAKNFPPQPRPKPVVVPGPMSVPFKEWTVPSLGSRPHAP